MSGWGKHERGGRMDASWLRLHILLHSDHHHHHHPLPHPDHHHHLNYHHHHPPSSSQEDLAVDCEVLKNKIFDQWQF